MDELIMNAKAVYTQRYADFAGRSSKGEYWWAILGWAVIYVGLLILSAIEAAVIGTPLFVIILVIFALGTIIPNLAAQVRRLHDTGKSGWMLLISLIPFGGLYVLYLLVQDSTGPNEYGNPAGAAAGGYAPQGGQFGAPQGFAAPPGQQPGGFGAPEQPQQWGQQPPGAPQQPAPPQWGQQPPGAPQQPAPPQWGQQPPQQPQGDQGWGQGQYPPPPGS